MLFGSWDPERQGSTEIITDFPHAVIKGVDEEDVTEFSDPGDEPLLDVQYVHGIV